MSTSSSAPSTTPTYRPSAQFVLPMARQQELVAALLGLHDVTWVRLSDGCTSTVYRIPERRLVVRFSTVPTRLQPLTAQVARAAALVGAGVPFAFPAMSAPLVFADDTLEGSPVGAATVWHDLGPSAPVDYADLGQALRLLHDDGPRVLADDRALGVVSDFHHMAARLDRARGRGAVTVGEYDVLVPWLDRMADLHPGHPHEGEVVLVHGDVHPKNVVQTRHGAHLLDPDNLAWGGRNHDLSFVSCAHEAGTIDATTVARFEAGYGAQIPEMKTAWAHAYPHRFRWVLDLIERRPDPEAARMLATEMPLWALPRGPRDQ